MYKVLLWALMNRTTCMYLHINIYINIQPSWFHFCMHDLILWVSLMNHSQRHTWGLVMCYCHNIYQKYVLFSSENSPAQWNTYTSAYCYESLLWRLYVTFLTLHLWITDLVSDTGTGCQWPFCPATTTGSQTCECFGLANVTDTWCFASVKIQVSVRRCLCRCWL